MSVGFFLTALAFLIPYTLEGWLEEAPGTRPSIGWQLLAYIILTTAEVLVSITGLEFSYTQAPQRMKSAVLALFLCSTSAGNLLTVLVNLLIRQPDGSSRWTDRGYFLFFLLLMLATAIAFVPFAASYQEVMYVQEAAESEGAESEGEMHSCDALSSRAGSTAADSTGGGCTCVRKESADAAGASRPAAQVPPVCM